jgi:hypothetical protein
MKKSRHLRLSAVILASLLITSGSSFAAESDDDTPKGKTTSLSKANQAMNDPISSFTLFITENDVRANNGNITDKNRYQNITIVEPVVPISLGDTGWNLVNRPVIPIVWAETPQPGLGFDSFDWDKDFGLSDIVFFSLLKPPSTGKFLWAVGPTFTFPTATNDSLGSEKYSVGPAAVALYSSPKMTFGALAQQWWSFAGNSDRGDVSLMNLQYFLTFQFNDHWSFLTAPIISANWDAKSGNKWAVPISAGVSY